MTPAIYVDIDTWWQTTFVLEISQNTFDKNIQIDASASCWFPGEVLFVVEKRKNSQTL